MEVYSPIKKQITSFTKFDLNCVFCSCVEFHCSLAKYPPIKSHLSSSKSMFLFISHCFSRPLFVLAFPYTENTAKNTMPGDAELAMHENSGRGYVGPAAASVARQAPSHFIPRRVEPRGLSGSTGFSFCWLISPVSFCFEARSHSHLFTIKCMSSLSFSWRRSTYLTSKSSFD